MGPLQYGNWVGSPMKSNVRPSYALSLTRGPMRVMAVDVDDDG